MSTYWYFECEDHDPPLRSSDEFTQHTDDEHFKNAVRLAAMRPVLKSWDMPDDYWEGMDRSRDYFERNARAFLNQHPKCGLGLVNEYGVRRELESER